MTISNSDIILYIVDSTLQRDHSMEKPTIEFILALRSVYTKMSDYEKLSSANLYRMCWL